MRDLFVKLMESPEQALVGVPAWLALAAVLIVSLAGSAHCAAMCGVFPLVLRAGRKDDRAVFKGGEVALYHFGRAVAYSLMGAAAGSFGQVALDVRTSRGVALATAVVLGVVLMVAGWRMIRGRAAPGTNGRSTFGRLAARLSASALRIGRGRLFGAPLVGAAAVFLPCGWLYAFVASAATTGSALMGGAVMFAFWLGTIPALSVLPALFGGFAERRGPGARRIAGALLIVAGVSLIGFRLGPVSHFLASAAEEDASCH